MFSTINYRNLQSYDSKLYNNFIAKLTDLFLDQIPPDRILLDLILKFLNDRFNLPTAQHINS